MASTAHGKTHVNMLTLANQTRRLWRKAAHRAQRFWFEAHRAGRLTKRPPIADSALSRGEELRWRHAKDESRTRLTRWRTDAAVCSKLETLVELYFPHAMRARAIAAFAAMRSHMDLEIATGSAARRISLRRGRVLWLLYTRRSRHGVLLAELADTAYAASRPRELLLAGCLATWRTHVSRRTFADGSARLGALAAAAAGLRRGLTQWRRASAVARFRAYHMYLAHRACCLASMRRGFIQLMRLVLAARRLSGERGTAEDVRLLLHVRCHALVARTLRTRIALAFGALRRELIAWELGGWAALHACTRGQEYACAAALKQWCSQARGVTHDSAVARIARVYILMAARQKQARQEEERPPLSPFEVPITHMADVLRCSDLT